MKTSLTLAALLALSSLVPAAVVQAAPTLSPIPTPFNQVAPPVNPDHFEFVVGGDNRPPGHDDPMPRSLDEICKEIGWIRPDFVLWTGDEIEGYEDNPADAEAEYDSFLASAALCQTPIFSIPGNHEVPDPSLPAVYQAKMGALYGSFDYGNSHFIGLDSTPVVNGVVVEADFDDAQWQWLTQDLAAHAGKSANIFVFFHHYAFGPTNPDDPKAGDTGLSSIAVRDRLHKLFVKYGVRAVFCGHDHLYWHGVRDGIDYFVAGNAGAPMDAPPDQGGFLGYMIVGVDGNKIETEAIPAWDIQVRTIRGNDGASSTGSIAIDNSEYNPLLLRGITVSMPAGTSYSVAGAADYKGKSKPVKTSIVSQTPSADGKSVTVTIAAEVPHARTTILTVGPATPGGMAGTK
jgi:3',5'-cyclic AMP phosphodiesterase CpdA